MNSRMYIGLDPGGVGTFGWAVAESASAKSASLVATGRAPNAKVAVETCLKFVSGNLAAVGIDAPLFWTATGVRRADASIRREMHLLGAKTPSGTVQQLNSLRGACLVQGVTAAILVRQLVPKALITETHPKALLWLLGLASAEREPRKVGLSELSPYVTTSVRQVSEHERDAAISCVAAVALDHQWKGWFDIADLEPEPVPLVPGRIAYWIPSLTRSDASGR